MRTEIKISDRESPLAAAGLRLSTAAAMLSWHAQVLAQAKNVKYDALSKMAERPRLNQTIAPGDQGHKAELVRPLVAGRDLSVSYDDHEGPSSAEEDMARTVARLQAEVQHYKKSALASQEDVGFWERACQERESVIANLEKKLEKEKEKRKEFEAEVEDNSSGGPSKMEQLQAEALLEKAAEIEDLRLVAKDAKQRIAKAEDAASHAAKGNGKLLEEYLLRAEKAEESLLEVKHSNLGSDARVAALERHLAKRSEEVAKLREALGDYDPALPDEHRKLQREYDVVKNEVRDRKQDADDMLQMKIKCRDSEAEVSQLQKQRRHLESRLEDLKVNLSNANGTV